MLTSLQKKFCAGFGVTEGVVVIKRDAEAIAAGVKSGGFKSFVSVDFKSAFPLCNFEGGYIDMMIF